MNMHKDKGNVYCLGRLYTSCRGEFLMYLYLFSHYHGDSVPLAIAQCMYSCSLC